MIEVWPPYAKELIGTRGGIKRAVDEVNTAIGQVCSLTIAELIDMTDDEYEELFLPLFKSYKSFLAYVDAIRLVGNYL